MTTIKISKWPPSPYSQVWLRCVFSLKLISGNLGGSAYDQALHSAYAIRHFLFFVDMSPLFVGVRFPDKTWNTERDKCDVTFTTTCTAMEKIWREQNRIVNKTRLTKLCNTLYKWGHTGTVARCPLKISPRANRLISEAKKHPLARIKDVKVSLKLL